MSDVQAIADRIEIEALRGEFADAVMMRGHDRVASLVHPGRRGAGSPTSTPRLSAGSRFG